MSHLNKSRSTMHRKTLNKCTCPHY